MSIANCPPSSLPGSNHRNFDDRTSGSAPDAYPDLLNAEPSCRIDREQTRLAIVLAFSGGVSGGLFTDALDRARMAPSSWNPELYVNDVFLAEFVNQCFRIRIGREDFTLATSHLVRLLARPPADAATVHYRRAIAAELARSPEQRQELE
jgi:DNA mismatch repair protein MutS2